MTQMMGRTWIIKLIVYQNHITDFIPAMLPRKVLKETVSNAAIKSIKNHLWFLIDRNVVLTLAGDKVDENVRVGIAQALLKCPRPEIFKLGKSLFPQLNMESISSLSSFLASKPE